MKQKLAEVLAYLNSEKPDELNGSTLNKSDFSKINKNEQEAVQFDIYFLKKINETYYIEYITTVVRMETGEI